MTECAAQSNVCNFLITIIIVLKVFFSAFDIFLIS